MTMMPRITYIMAAQRAFNLLGIAISKRIFESRASLEEHGTGERGILSVG
jgi:hypothetical protein